MLSDVLTHWYIHSYTHTPIHFACTGKFVCPVYESAAAAAINAGGRRSEMLVMGNGFEGPREGGAAEGIGDDGGGGDGGDDGGGGGGASSGSSQPHQDQEQQPIRVLGYDVYIGEWVGDQKHGAGRHEAADGETYEVREYRYSSMR
jgi:hypothetical protein